jgi:hypothetical protein
VRETTLTEGETFFWFNWHFGGYDRRKHDAHGAAKLFHEKGRCTFAQRHHSFYFAR